VIRPVHIQRRVSMLALKFTQKLLKDMKVTPPIELDQSNTLFNWHVNILQLRKKHIMFVNDQSRLCLIVEGIRSGQLSKLQEKFSVELREYLQLEGLKRSHIEQYFLEAGEFVIGKTDNRSVIGTMTEMSFLSAEVDFEHTYDLSSWLNNMMYKPIDYEEPIKVFKELLVKKYS